MDLTIEQRFSIASFEQQTKGMSREQALVMLNEMYVQMIRQQNGFKVLLADKWGIGDVDKKMLG